MRHEEHRAVAPHRHPLEVAHRLRQLFLHRERAARERLQRIDDQQVEPEVLDQQVGHPREPVGRDVREERRVRAHRQRRAGNRRVGLLARAVHAAGRRARARPWMASERSINRSADSSPEKRATLRPASAARNAIASASADFPHPTSPPEHHEVTAPDAAA